MNPDQRESLERKNPHRYGGLGLVSIYVHECQTLLFCVNLYCSKPHEAYLHFRGRENRALVLR